MMANDQFAAVQESNPHQAFLPIFATLFFAVTASPILLGFGEYEARSRATGPIRADRLGSPVVVASCDLAEHGEPGHRCGGRRG